jgi:hypothetical protein
MMMVFWPLVIARWIHFACVFTLFGCSFFWLYERQERSSAGHGGLPRTLSRDNHFAPHRSACRSDFRRRLARVDFDQYDALLWQRR